MTNDSLDDDAHLVESRDNTDRKGCKKQESWKKNEELEDTRKHYERNLNFSQTKFGKVYWNLIYMWDKWLIFDLLSLWLEQAKFYEKLLFSDSKLSRYLNRIF